MERMIKAAEVLGYRLEEVIDILKGDKRGGPHGFIQIRDALPLLESLSEYLKAVNEELIDTEEPQADDEPAEESEEPTLT